MERLPMLPNVDIAIGETGGRCALRPTMACYWRFNLAQPQGNCGRPRRILKRGEDGGSMKLDEDWAARFAAVSGPLETEEPAEQRCASHRCTGWL